MPKFWPASSRSLKPYVRLVDISELQPDIMHKLGNKIDKDIAVLVGWSGAMARKLCHAPAITRPIIQGIIPATFSLLISPSPCWFLLVCCFLCMIISLLMFWALRPKVFIYFAFLYVQGEKVFRIQFCRPISKYISK